MSTGMRRGTQLLLGFLMSHVALAQRGRLAADKRLPVRETVAAAETEGAAYPRGPAREHDPVVFAGNPIGTPERKCTSGPSTDVAAGKSAGFDFSYTPVGIRSGDFVIGGQIGAGTPPGAGRQSKIWWAPYHNPHEHFTPLVVRGARLGHPGDTIRYMQPNHAWPGRGPETDAFFPSGIELPRPGRWLLIATAGDDWGCFILTAHAGPIFKPAG
jgi:hypothetical protein